MNIATATRISLGAVLSLVLSACATDTGSGAATGEDAALQNEYARTIPVCVGEAECGRKMQAASEWVARTTGYGLVVNTAERIETGGWGRGQYPAVRVNRQPIGGGRDWILIEIDCGTATIGTRFGARTCPPSQEAAIDFNLTVSTAN